MTPSALDQFRTDLLNAGERRACAMPPRRRRRRTPLLAAAALAVLVLGGGSAAAITLLSNAPDDPYDPAPRSPMVVGKAHPLSRAEREARQRERRQHAPVLPAARYFSVLKRPATPTDRVPHRTDQTGVRLATSGSLGRVYIRHTPRETCVIALRAGEKGSTGSCAPTAQARTRGVVVYEQCFKTGPPQRRFVAGVVPDGVLTVTVTRTGAPQATARVHDNGFILETIEPFDTLAGLRTRVPPVTC
jgi:hypothetical protein